MPKKFSIVVATFNAEASISDLIDSIRIQKTGEVEIIFVDGGSSDSTIKIIQESKIADVIISEKDSGIYDAWNKGLRVLNSKWVMFLGADDVVLPQTFKYWIEIIEGVESDVELISGRNYLVDKSGKIIKAYGKPAEWRSLSKMMVIAHVGAMHSIKIFEKYGQFDSSWRICGDYDLLLRSKGCLKVMFVDKILVKTAIGGMSYSYSAIIEAFVVRKKNQSISWSLNCLVTAISLLYFTVKKRRI
jgi:glycosyltransferase involved in cell wall biosynthesis